jgi:hypothetical protein
MARELNMQFSGRIGPLIGCLRDGKYYYRSRPGKVRQTKATKASSSIFALASMAGRIMRLYLQHSIPNPKDIQMQRRLVGSISNWLRLAKGQPMQPTTDIPFVNHFEFNPAKPLDYAWRLCPGFMVTGPGMAQLQVPAFVPVETIKAPANTKHIQVCISAVALRLDSYSSFGTESLTIDLAYNDTAQPARSIALQLQTEPGNILIAAIQLRYGTERAGQVTYLKPDKLPAAIVGAVYL